MKIGNEVLHYVVLQILDLLFTTLLVDTGWFKVRRVSSIFTSSVSKMINMGEHG